MWQHDPHTCVNLTLSLRNLCVFLSLARAYKGFVMALPSVDDTTSCFPNFYAFQGPSFFWVLEMRRNWESKQEKSGNDGENYDQARQTEYGNETSLCLLTSLDLCITEQLLLSCVAGVPQIVRGWGVHFRRFFQRSSRCKTPWRKLPTTFISMLRGTSDLHNQTGHQPAKMFRRCKAFLYNLWIRHPHCGR